MTLADRPKIAVDGIGEIPEVSLGWQIADFVETLLTHGPGDIQGSPIELDPEFLGSIIEAYELDPESGRRPVNEFHLWAPKGRAKSEVAGMLTVAEAVGPVRFSHWATRGESSWWGYEYEPGEPVGRTPTYPFIRCMATEEGQSGNTYTNVQFMMTDAVDRGYFRADVGLTRTFLPGGGEIRPSTASSSSKDGGKETFAVFDETHLYTIPDLHRMYATVNRNLTKRKIAEPWALSTSTMYLPGEGSVAELVHQHAEKLIRGELTDPGFRFRWFHGPDPETWDFDDDAELAEALRAAYGSSSSWIDIDRIIELIRSPLTDPVDALRYYVNVPAGAADAVVAPAVWRDLEVDRRLRLDDTIVLGFDGSQSDDATALVAIRPVDGTVFELGVWERPDGPLGKGWKVPRDEVDQLVDVIHSMYRVALMYCDPPRQPYIDRWIMKYGKDSVLEWPSWSDRRITSATDAFDALVRAREIRHAQSPTLTRHFGNARRARARGGWRPVKRADSAKIDGALATLAAVAAWGDALKRGKLDAGDSDPLENIW